MRGPGIDSPAVREAAEKLIHGFEGYLARFDEVENEGAGFWWANSLNTFTRNVAYAVAPAFAGAAMQGLSMASPLFFGGGIKIVYDLALYTAFRHVKPPEER